MKNFFKKYKIEVMIFFTAFLVRVFYAIFIEAKFGQDVFVSYSDATVYVKLANNLIHNNIFSEALLYPHLVPDSMRTPGYPVFLAIFQFFKASFLFTIIVQDFLAGMLAVVIYRITVLLFENKKVAMVSAGIFALDPAMIYWSNLLMSDHLAGVFFAVTILLFAQKKYLWSGLSLGVATLVRPVFLYLFPLFYVMLLCLNWSQVKIFFRKKMGSGFAWLRPFFIFTLAFLIVVAPWMGRNYKQFGHFSLSSNGWMAITFFITQPFTTIHNIPFSWPVAPDSYYNFPGVENLTKPNKNTYYRYEFFNHSFYKEQFFAMVKKYPVDYFIFHFGSSAKGFFKADYDYLVNHVLLPKVPQFPRVITKIFMLFYFLLWYSLCFFALTTIFYKKYRIWAIFFLAFPLLNVLLTGPISAGSGAGRYNMAFSPFMVILGCLGIFAVYNKLKIKAIKSKSGVSS